MSTEIRSLSKEGEPELLSHYRVNKNKWGQEITVPVIDVRDGLTYRMLAMHTMSGNNRSKWINYNHYHTSRKPKQNI